MIIVEKKLEIPADYQYKAIRSKNIFQAQWHKNKWLAIEVILKSLHNKKILDLGTGSGNFELLFSDKAKKIVGIDYNPDPLRFLRNV